jgi:hypothetical protein
MSDHSTMAQIGKLIFAVALLFSFPALHSIQILSLDHLLFRSIYGFADNRIWFEAIDNHHQSSNPNNNNNNYNDNDNNDNNDNLHDSFRSDISDYSQTRRRSSQVSGGRGICCVKLGDILPENSFSRRLFLTSISLSIMVCLSIIDDIALVFGFVGATSGSLVVFVLPGCFVFVLDSYRSYRLFGLSVVVFGVVTGLLCVVATVIEIVDFVKEF